MGDNSDDEMLLNNNVAGTNDEVYIYKTIKFC